MSLQEPWKLTPQGPGLQPCPRAALRRGGQDVAWGKAPVSCWSKVEGLEIWPWDLALVGHISGEADASPALPLPPGHPESALSGLLSAVEALGEG